MRSYRLETNPDREELLEMAEERKITKEYIEARNYANMNPELVFKRM